MSGRRRAGWTALDQALSSATNMGVAVVVARSSDAVGFGAFSVTWLAATLATGLTRAVVAEPLTVRFSASSPAEQRRAGAAATGTALVVGTGLGLLAAVAAAAVAGPLRGCLLALAVGLPGLLLQDTWRFVFFAGGMPHRAVVNDACWAAVQVALLAVAAPHAHGRPALTTLAWGGAATVAGLTAIRQAGFAPRPAAVRRWLCESSRFAAHYVVEYGARAGARQLTVAAVTVLVGLEALAGVRAAQVVFGPLNVVLLSAGLAAAPEAVRTVARHPGLLARRLALLTGGLVALSVAYTAAVAAVPHRIGRSAFGASWDHAAAVLVPQGLLMASVAAAAGSLVGLRALRAPARSTAVRLAAVPLSVGGGVAGAVTAGGPGALLGLAAANLVAAALFVAQLRAALRLALGAATDGDGAPTPATAGPRSRGPGPRRRRGAASTRTS